MIGENIKEDISIIEQATGLILLIYIWRSESTEGLLEPGFCFLPATSRFKKSSEPW